MTRKPDLASWRRLAPADASTLPRFLATVGLFSIVVMLIQVALWFANSTDYVGMDRDDAMRLVEVRDYLGGQGWFDLHQYRLGPDGGTLMHWSRLIDWPIATLIRFYGLFLDPRHAEAAALITWPLLLIPPLLASIGLACHRLGGRSAMTIGLILTAVFLAAIVRFRPGAIDHHNVQLVLVVFIVAMLLDPLARASNFAAAAVAGGMALAIGAETTPHMAVVSAAVALLWAVQGEQYRRAAIGFGTAFALATGLIFLATTPPRLWSAVTCDTLSLGYLSLAAVGGLALAGSAAATAGRSAAIRFGWLAATGIVVVLIAMTVAPQCLQSPLGDLDPLLKTYWITAIGEAQSIASVLDESPGNIGTFYAVGLIGAAVCLMRILRREQTIPHAILLGLIGLSWAISAVQVRGMIFANVLAFVPLSALVADLRGLYLERRTDARAVVAFALSALFSVPSVWTVVGVLASEPIVALARTNASTSDKIEKESDSVLFCVDEKSAASIAALPKGRILASFNEGPALLRFTHHSVLTANYHRNQSGMVAALRIGMTTAQDALPLLEAQDIRYIVLCDADKMAARLEAEYPAGLYAALHRGEVPGYLDELPGDPAVGLRVYELIQR